MRDDLEDCRYCDGEGRVISPQSKTVSFTPDPLPSRASGAALGDLLGLWRDREAVEGVGAVKQRAQLTYLQRASISAGRLHISLREYLDHIEAGEVRCSLGKHWVPASEASKTLKYCLACARERGKAYYREQGYIDRAERAGRVPRSPVAWLTYHAARCGVTVDEYLLHKDVGDRWCSGCRAFLSNEHFFRVRTSRCRSCDATYKQRRRIASLARKSG